MKWMQPADREVVEAVVAVFRAPTDHLSARLAKLAQAQWERSYYWLDASGMALYLLARIERLELEDAMPAATLARLRQNLAENRRRTDSMRAEFAELNREFQELGVRYCNLKGFTLAPHSCPDPVLRCQLDFDLLVDGRDLNTCREILNRRGYALRGSTNTVWEFKTETDELADIADHYKPRPQRCVEIHFACDAEAPHAPVRDERLDRLSWIVVGAEYVPALSEVDQFIGQAAHLFGHVCSPCTRLAWVLEFARHIETRSEDHEFWREVMARLTHDRNAQLAVGVSCALAMDVFRAAVPHALQAVVATTLPERAALWLQRYGTQALLADFPGTKLHLLLREQLNAGNPAWKEEKRRTLVPSRRAPRIVHVAAGVGLVKRFRGELYQLRFELFRLRFHVVEGARYVVEAARWRRFLQAREKDERGEIEGHARTTARHP